MATKVNTVKLCDPEGEIIKLEQFIPYTRITAYDGEEEFTASLSAKLDDLVKDYIAKGYKIIS